MRKEYLECGKIINTHGIAGAVKLECWCDSPEVLAGLKRLFLAEGQGYKEYKVLTSSVFKSFVIAKLGCIADIDAAQTLVGQTVYACRGEIALDEGDNFIADLIGLEVKDASDGHVYGRLKDVINAGASDIYVIETPEGERMMPAVDEFVNKIDLDDGIFISPIEGMFN